ncbi:MAG: HAD family phosphatase [Clostridia bacterium]|nr:HAD family phosphatase [Clostridia bacterium]
MKRFEGILICTDLDGTLLGSDRRVSDENLAAIRYFQERGGRFTFVTGRMPSCMTDIYSTVRPNAPVGCINGGGVYDGEAKKYIYTKELDRSALELARDVLRAFPDIGMQIDCFETIWFCRENRSMELFRKITGVPNLRVEIDDVKEPIAKVVFGSSDIALIDELRAFCAAHPDADRYDFVRSEKTLYEILPKGVNKGAVLPHLAAYLGISPSRVIAVGDYSNDVEMIRDAGVGIAVANALPEVKAASDLVTVSNDEHAIAQIIGDIDSGKLKL